MTQYQASLQHKISGPKVFFRVMLSFYASKNCAVYQGGWLIDSAVRCKALPLFGGGNAS